ncbi:hypothetical protein [Pseudomonas sp. UM16]|uniref:hypothetical protein n=1 Tax=Pseudomonas sp. UM16 TaxID=3158962 RepID=UPI00399004A1
MNDNVIADTGADRVDVVDGEIVAYSGNVSFENRECGKYSHMFAVDAATRKHDPVDEAEAWFHTYVQAFKACGWVPVKFTHDFESSQSSEVTIDTLVVKAAATAAAFLGTGGGAAVILPKLAQDALGTLAKSDEAIEALSIKSSKQNGTALSIASCAQHPSGEVIMAVGAVQTSAVPGRSGKFLFVAWNSSSATTYSGSAAFVLHRSLYDENANLIVSAP